MKITFIQLAESHFPLLLKWLEAPHVKAWWPVDRSFSVGGDQDVTYTLDLVHEKYSSYVKGYKLVDGQQKPIQGFIIHNNQNPVGYIQIYNAYDFPRSKTLSGLPANLGAFDIFIGEESALQQGLGSKAILEFLKLHGNQYTHIFADPDSNNVAAVKCYEKAGFKKVSKQADTEEVWMLKDLSLRNDSLPTIQKLIKERYPDAKAIFWAGSVSVNQGTSASDLDLVIVFEKVDHAYRAAFIYDGWPIDAFIHDLNTLRYFFEESRTGNGISGLCYMILNGREVTNLSAFSKNVKILAQEVLNSGPAIWDQEQINKERFLITDVLDDIKYPVRRDEQIASAAWLLEALGQFYFRSKNKWCASGKSIIRYLKSDNPDLALEFTQAFESLFQMGHPAALELLVKKILDPYGGLFWNGFRSDAPTEWKVPNEHNILEELKSREPIFHHPEMFGKTKEDIENQMCDEFWEVGASGNVYTRQDVIETLLERYNDPSHQDIWEAKDFALTQIAPNNYLLTYILIQNKTRVTRRSTIWRGMNGSWKILYHQGTVIDGGGA